jgi:hypothetical protein
VGVDLPGPVEVSPGGFAAFLSEKYLGQQAMGLDIIGGRGENIMQRGGGRGQLTALPLHHCSDELNLRMAGRALLGQVQGIQGGQGIPSGNGRLGQQYLRRSILRIRPGILDQHFPGGESVIQHKVTSRQPPPNRPIAGWIVFCIY